jgi:hypothetical protein
MEDQTVTNLKANSHQIKILEPWVNQTLPSVLGLENNDEDLCAIVLDFVRRGATKEKVEGLLFYKFFN